MSDTRESLTDARETEHKTEPDHGWFFDRESGETTPWYGIRIFWRFRGERKWRRRVIVPDESQGQTTESLYQQMDEIVASLARQAANA